MEKISQCSSLFWPIRLGTNTTMWSSKGVPHCICKEGARMKMIACVNHAKL